MGSALALRAAVAEEVAGASSTSSHQLRSTSQPVDLAEQDPARAGLSGGADLGEAIILYGGFIQNSTPTETTTSMEANSTEMTTSMATSTSKEANSTETTTSTTTKPGPDPPNLFIGMAVLVMIVAVLVLACKCRRRGRAEIEQPLTEDRLGQATAVAGA